MTDEGRENLTTHAEWGAGNPRLLVSSPEQTQFVYDIPATGATIGSGADCTLKLAGAEPFHAEIVHDDRDEYVLLMHAAGETSANVEKAAEEQHRENVQLRTGARFTAGPWQLVFVREEFADHGRPFGGREGGEGSDQPTQESRPGYGEGPEHPEDAEGAPADGTDEGGPEPYGVNAQGDATAAPRPPADS